MLKNIDDEGEDSSNEEESIDDAPPDSDKTNGNKTENTKGKDEIIFEEDENVKLSKQRSIFENLFEKYHFWISREVPRESLQFVIKSFGGKVFWDGNGLENDKSITHHVIDRTTVVGDRIVTRDYVQPQWVYDCINARVIIPPNEYGPGCKLPPHLSPFVDDYEEGYVPDYRKKLDNLYKQTNGIPLESIVVPTNEQEESESDEEERFVEDLAAEKQGNYDTDGKKHKKSENIQQQEEEEQKSTAAALLPRRRRRLLQRIKYSKRMKQKAINLLEKKKLKLNDGCATVIGKNTIVYK